jgi:hypothetical protein
VTESQAELPMSGGSAHPRRDVLIATTVAGPLRLLWQAAGPVTAIG